MFEIGYIIIALIIGAIRWQRAKDNKERFMAVLAAAAWPIVCLITEVTTNKDNKGELQ